MDKVNILNNDKFPMYREGLNMIQEAAFMAAKMALLGGDNYILQGCIDDGNGNVSSGLIVIDGEILPFAGGALKSHITIKETQQSVTAFAKEYPEAYTFRVAQFANNGEYSWSDFEQIQTNKELYKDIRDIKGDAPGTVKMWAGMIAKIPADYKLCDGSVLAINSYPELYDTLGISFGGDGQNSFNLPDLRGRFIVGYDSANPDYNAINRDKIGGAKEVTLTTDQLPAHDHTNGQYFNKLSARAADVDATNTPGSIDDKTPDAEYRVGGMTTPQWLEATIAKVGANKAHENRPPFFTLAYIIKVR